MILSRRRGFKKLRFWLLCRESIIIFSFNTRTRGFKEFGNPENLTNPELPQSGSSPSSVSPVSSKHLNAGTASSSLDRSLSHNVVDGDVVAPPPTVTRMSGGKYVKTTVEENTDDSSDDEVCFSFYSSMTIFWYFVCLSNFLFKVPIKSVYCEMNFNIRLNLVSFTKLSCNNLNQTIFTHYDKIKCIKQERKRDRPREERKGMKAILITFCLYNFYPNHFSSCGFKMFLLRWIVVFFSPY